MTDRVPSPWDGDDGDFTVHKEGGPVADAADGLDLLVKFDGRRKTKRWTVAIPGVARGDGDTPKEAGHALWAALQALGAARGR